MAFEKKWRLVPPQNFTSDGGALGQVVIASTFGFYAKQSVIVRATGQTPLLLEIKRVLSETDLIIGPKGSISNTIDLSAYTTALSANIEAPEQPRNPIDPKEIVRATFEEEPAVAWRTLPVDRLGNVYTLDNPFPVELSDGSVNIGTVNAELEVQLSHEDDDPDVGDVHDSVRIGDGEDELEINPDGSINVNINSTNLVNPFIINYSVPLAATEEQITLPIATKKFSLKARGNSKIQLAYASGDSSALYYTLFPGNTHEENGLNTTVPLDIFLQTSKNGEVVEILYWT